MDKEPLRYSIKKNDLHEDIIELYGEYESYTVVVDYRNEKETLMYLRELRYDKAQDGFHPVGEVRSFHYVMPAEPRLKHIEDGLHHIVTYMKHANRAKPERRLWHIDLDHTLEAYRGINDTTC